MTHGESKINSLKELTEEISKEREKERRTRKPLLITSLVISTGGAILLGVYTSWQVCVAFILLLWGNNIWLRTRRT